VRLQVDESMSGRRLASLLHAAGHDIVTADEAGLVSATGPRVLIRATAEG
jgi:hypothetical protein